MLFIPLATIVTAMLATGDSEDKTLRELDRLLTLPMVYIPAGSLLFHGTLESIHGPLCPGIDGAIWFADCPAIAQLYIPKSGGSTYFSADSLRYPDRDEPSIQRWLGIVYDYDRVQRDEHGRLKSFPLPEGWSRLPTTDDIEKMLDERGVEKKHGDYMLRTNVGRILEPGEVQSGTLFVAKVTRPLRVYARSRSSGDLMDPQHLDMGAIETARRLGCDRILIKDYAQSEEWGNFGHMSVGLFSTDGLKISIRPAQYREWDRETKGSTPEYPGPVEMYLHKL